MSQLTDLFTGVANAIRAKNGSSETIQAANFAATIAALPALKTGTFTPTSAYFHEIDILDAVGLSNIAFLLGAKDDYQITGDKILSGSIIDGVGVGCRCYNSTNIYNDATPTWDATTGKLSVDTTFTFADKEYRWVAW
mgnify:CR=1 FL=1|nr:MAG TPA: hypothetical protein [Caudoviricetes sp.]